MMETTDKERADCNMACLLHLCEMVETGDYGRAHAYIRYVRSMLRFARLAPELDPSASDAKAQSLESTT